MAKMTADDVMPGQRFQQQKAGFVWTVNRLITFPGEDVQHVQLINDRDQSSTKTVSLDALLDRTLFRLVV